MVRRERGQRGQILKGWEHMRDHIQHKELMKVTKGRVEMWDQVIWCAQNVMSVIYLHVYSLMKNAWNVLLQLEEKEDS